MRKHLKLFKKEFLLQKKNIPLTIIIVFVLILSNKNGDVGNLPININLITSIFLISSMTITASMVNDEKAKASSVVHSLPFKRRDFVINKYLFAIVTVLALSTCVFVINIVLSDNSLFAITITDIMIVIGIVNIYYSPIFPIYFKYGYSKTQMFNTLIIALIVGLSAYTNTTGTTGSVEYTLQPADSSMLLLSGILTMVASFLVYITSCIISIKIYKKKDL